MIGFSITTWCIAVIMLCLGISLLRGNYTLFMVRCLTEQRIKQDTQNSLETGLLLAAGIAISGVIAVVLPQEYAMPVVIISCYWWQ